MADRLHALLVHILKSKVCSTHLNAKHALLDHIVLMVPSWNQLFNQLYVPQAPTILTKGLDTSSTAGLVMQVDRVHCQG